MDLISILDDMITSGLGLALVAGAYAVWWLSGFIPNLFSPKKWSWIRGLEDFCKAFLMGLVVVATVGLLGLGGQFFAMLGWDITKGTEAFSTFALIGAMSTGFVYYLGKAAMNAWKFLKLVKSDSEGDLTQFEKGKAEVGKAVREFLETITTKTDREHMLEEAASTSNLFNDVAIAVADAGKGGIVNTYPEPYRSAAQDSMTDPSSCYNREAQPAGTLVTLEDGSYKAIEDIQVGDRLWNHDGSGSVVVKSLWEDNKPVYTIRTGAGDIRFTGEHPLYTRQNKWKALARGDLKAFGAPKFVKTKDLKVGDKVFLPQLQGESLGLTPSELRWLGFYLGDGTKASKGDKCPIYRLIVADGRKREYVESLGIEGSYSKHSKSEHTQFFTLAKKSAPALRKVLDTFDGKSFGTLVCPEDAQYIVEGFLEADGHKIKEGLYSASSTDKKLLLALQRMVLSLGGTMSIHKKYDGGELEKFGTTVYAKTCWDVNINLAPKRSRIHDFNDGKYATITAIKIGIEEEAVYNIEVSGSHTYIADNHGVHNCVSYCAWKVKEATGAWPKRTGSMNAKYWVERLAENGYSTVVKAPQAGGLYVGVTPVGPYGHVVWYEGGQTVSEYNYATRGAFSVRMIDLSAYTWVQIKAPTTPAIPTTAVPDKAPAKKDGTVIYTYKAGDTFGQVISDLGLTTEHGLWGPDGDVAYYTNQLHDQGIWGNIPINQVIKLTPRK